MKKLIIYSLAFICFILSTSSLTGQESSIGLKVNRGGVSGLNSSFIGVQEHATGASGSVELEWRHLFKGGKWSISAGLAGSKWSSERAFRSRTGGIFIRKAENYSLDIPISVAYHMKGFYFGLGLITSVAPQDLQILENRRRRFGQGPVDIGIFTYVGYRYKFNERFSATAELKCQGMLHSGYTKIEAGIGIHYTFGK